MNLLPKIIHRKLVAAILFIAAMLFGIVSCEENISQAKKDKKTDFPSKIIYNAYIVQRDSGFVKIRFKAPILQKYEFVDTPYIEAKKGLYLEFFDAKKPKTPGKLWADYAKFIEPQEFYMAKGHVKVINNEGQTFVMNSIYWDKKDRKMYTSDTVFITDKNGNTFVAANGMRAKDDFSEYTLKNNSGNFNPKNMSDMGGGKPSPKTDSLESVPTNTLKVSLDKH
ncbi:LPS export ABC transporter periplasmic protein LptC [Riemerella columbipharyngis]